MKTTLMALLLALSSLGCASCDPARCGASTPPPPERELFQFGPDADLSAWEIQDDVVMGGRSQGAFALNEAGNLVFSGAVSLENDGGFSSLQYGFEPIDVSQHRAIVLGLKGDGKRYQLRIESKKNARHSYAYDFQTSGAWQAIEIPFADMYAIHHCDRLDLPNYPGKTLAHLQLLIGNATAETFQIELDKIWLK
jgi:NADH dehydrogenase [ubiquinone] 1 alpha subcomplex assembly factor 1